MSARVAVGKGVRHGFVPHQTKHRQKTIDSSSQALATQHVSTTRVVPTPVEASLNALTQNFNQSMHDTVDNSAAMEGNPASVASHLDVNQYQLPAPAAVSTGSMGRVAYVPGSLHRDNSLVDLAMIPMIGDGTGSDTNVASSTGFSFVDFPFDSNMFSNEDLNI